MAYNNTSSVNGVLGTSLQPAIPPVNKLPIMGSLATQPNQGGVAKPAPISSSGIVPYQAPAGVSGGMSSVADNNNAGLLSSLQFQLKQKQDELAKAQAAPAPTVAPTPAPSPTPVYSQATQGLLNYTPNTQSYQDAQAYMQKKTDELSALNQGYADKYKNIDTSGVDQSLATGQENILARTQAAKAGAIQGAINQAQTGVGLAQQNNAQQLQALGQAAGVTQPQQMSPTSLYGTPETGNRIGNPAGAAGQAIQGANITSAADQQTALNTMTSFAQRNASLTPQLKQEVNSGLFNPSDITQVNGVLDWLAKGVGDVRYQKVANILNELTTNYANILGTSGGGNPTNLKIQISQDLINRLANKENLLQVVDSLEQQSQLEMQGMQRNIQNVGSGNTGTGGLTPIGSSGSTNNGMMFGSFSSKP